MKLINTKSLAFCLLTVVCLVHSAEEPDPAPRAAGTWNKEWSWDWKKINTYDLVFPQNFLWGTGTAAYQVEGGCTNNNWYQIEDQLPEKAGNTADHWNRYKEDIQLMKNLGLNSYKFSVEWSKIEPRENVFDPTVIAHYKDVCDECVCQGIQPVVNLHHYTDPIWFADKGGFEKEENIGDFVRFAIKIVQALQDKVSMWVTFNSPDAYAAKGYMQGMCPPYKKNKQLMGEVYKNMLETHVRTYHQIKKLNQTLQVGVMKSVSQLDPQNWLGSAGCSIARKIKDTPFYDFFKKGQFYIYLPFMVYVNHTNKDAIGALDFIGLSYYSHLYMHNFKAKGDTERESTKNPLYALYAEGLYRAIQEVAECLTQELQIPMYIAENGTAAVDAEKRDTFFKQYLYALSRAIQDGYDVRGYFYWSLMDNYEWGTYHKRYGLYHVDFTTQQRTLKNGTEHFINVVQGKIGKRIVK